VLGSKDFYGGEPFLEVSDNSIIFVRSNYRVLIALSSSIDEKLGAFGFLAGKTFQGEGGAGNAGLLDQMAALNWTRKYISYLGGGPNRYNLRCLPLRIVLRSWESQLVRAQ